MDFDANAFLLSMVVGGVGFVAFAYGKKQSRLPQMLAGVALMAYPYFVSNVWVMIAIAGVILGGLFLAVKLGA
ncbi:MAG: hypothetical protein ACHREM_02550 [Polyangiales bacterium]